MLNTDKEIAAFDNYLHWLHKKGERPKAASTRQTYVYTVKIFLQFCAGRSPNPELAHEYIKSLQERGSAPRSINCYIWALKAYFQFKGGDKLEVPSLKIESSKPRFVTEQEWEQLLATAQRPFYERRFPDYARKRAKLEVALLHIYYRAGLRPSEGVSLKLDNISQRMIKVVRREGREEPVPVASVVIQALEDYVASRPSNGPYVFPGKEPGSHMARRTAEGIIKQLCVRAGLLDLHVDSLRHTAFYHLRKLGASEKDIQDVLDPKSICWRSHSLAVSNPRYLTAWAA